MQITARGRDEKMLFYESSLMRGKKLCERFEFAYILMGFSNLRLVQFNKGATRHLYKYSLPTRVRICLTAVGSQIICSFFGGSVGRGKET